MRTLPLAAGRHPGRRDGGVGPRWRRPSQSVRQIVGSDDMSEIYAPDVNEDRDGPTLRLARFAAETRAADLPPVALEGARRLLLDTIACAVAAWDLPSSRIVRELLEEQGGRQESSVLVSGAKLPAPAAAYLNAHLSNAIDADDTLNYSAHIAASAVAPALAIAERVGASGLDTLAAIALGYEVAGRIGLSLRGLVVTPDGSFTFAPVTGYGWTSFAAAVASGRLLGVDSSRMRHAFGLAAAATPLPTSGKFGLDLPRPMTKYGLYGEMAQGGVMAALLAQRGFTADTTVLDGERGLWRMAGSLDCDWTALTDGIGTRWLVDEASYKSYPGCRFLNPAIDVFLDILRDEGLRADEVERVEALVPGSAIAKHMNDPSVESMVDGCFSLPYLLACAALAGPPGPGWHTDETRSDPAVRRFSAKVDVGVEPRAADAAKEDLTRYGHSVRMCTTVTVETAERRFTRSADYARGDSYTPQTRATAADIADKFRRYTVDVLGRERSERALAFGRELEAMDDLHQFMACLTTRA
ncbi:MmgE/PrpD family protein [Microbispora sp. CA-102843]|uniref:MmgE/PrpD family protein n=1 Tax=Microbispora sp. CA-102843 TaxID=3239952 RepID=UPI003D8CF138